MIWNQIVTIMMVGLVSVEPKAVYDCKPFSGWLHFLVSL